MTPRDVNLAYGNGQGVPVLHLPFDEGQGVVAHNQSWQKVGETVNLVANPSAETDAGNYASSWGDTISASSTVSVIGSKSIKILSDGTTAGVGSRRLISSDSITLEEGKTYSYSAWVYNPSVQGMDSGGVSIKIWGNNGGTDWSSLATSGVTYVRDAWVKLTTSIVYNNETAVKLGVWSENNSQDAGDMFYFDGVQFEQTSSATPYCDGSLTGSGTYAWNGTAHASTSTCTYGADGDVYGATWQSSGAKGGSLRFDGASSCLVAPHNFETASSAYSFSTWFKTSQSSGSRMILQANSGLGFGLYVNRFTAGKALAFFDSSSGNNSSADETITTVTDGNWHNISASNDGLITRIYVDGILENTYAETIYTQGGGDFRVGSNICTSAYFDGDIDEVKIFPYALSSSEVKQQFNFGNSLTLGGRTGGDQSSSSSRGSTATEGSLEDGLVGHWKMDESSWNGTTEEVLDSSGAGNDGTSYNSATTSSGKFGNAGNFDNTNIARIPHSSSLNLSEQITLSAWVKPDAIVAWDRILAKSNTADVSPNSMYGLMISGNSSACGLSATTGQVRFELASNNEKHNITSTSSLSVSTWTFVTATYDGVTARIYFNGVDQETSLCNQNLNVVVPTLSGGTIDTNTNDVTIGAAYFSAIGNQFDGLVDEARIYNRALDAVEIRNLYYFGPGPVAHWDFDENSGTVAKDTASHPELVSGSNNGVLTNGPTWVPGVKGSGLSFDGSNDYVELGNTGTSSTLPAGDIGFDDTQNFTLSTWYKGTDITNYAIGTALIGRNSTDIFANFGLDDGYVTYTHYDGAWQYNIRSTTLVADGDWHYVSYVNHSDATGDLYIDGIKEIDGLSSAMSASRYYKLDNIMLGWPDNYTQGLIDDVKIYNYALTPYQIAKEFNGGAPVAHYAFDEGDGQSVHNTGGINVTRLNDHSTSLDGYLGSSATTTTNDPTWVTDETACKKGKCLSFSEGSAQGVHILNNPAISFSNSDSYTVSAWVNRSISDTNYGVIIYKGGQDNTGPGYQLYFNPDSSVSLRQTWTGGPLYGLQISTIKLLTKGAWYQITATVNKVDNTARIYIDGVQNVTGDISAYGNTFSTIDMDIGKGGAGAFDGSIDDVKIFNYALSPEDVAREYNMGAAVRFSN